MFSGQSPASRKVQPMSTGHDFFGFSLPSSLYLLSPLRVANYTLDRVDLRFTSAGLSIVDVNNQFMSTIINIIAADLMNYLLHCSNGNMFVIRLYLGPLLDALACVDEKSPVRIATTTPGRFMVKGMKSGTEITFELSCVEVVQETSSETSAVVGFQCQYEGTMYGINEMLETLRTVADSYVTVSFVQQDNTDALRLNTHTVQTIKKVAMKRGGGKSYISKSFYSRYDLVKASSWLTPISDTVTFCKEDDSVQSKFSLSFPIGNKGSKVVCTLYPWNVV